jgi:hypothetical protein
LTRRAFGGAVLALGACSTWQPEPVRTLAPGTLRIGTYFVNPPFNMCRTARDRLRGDHERDRPPLALTPVSST